MTKKASSPITILYLVRHGESVSNKEGIISGHSDYELTEQGRQQVLQTKEALKHVHFDEVYSSDLTRATQTAEILSGQPVGLSNRMHTLRERDFGSLDGQSQDVYDEYSRTKHAMPEAERWLHKHVPDMENDREVTARFLPAIEKIARSHPGKTVLITGHGSAIRTSIMKIAGFSYSRMPAGTFYTAAYAELHYDPRRGFTVIQINGVRV
jgi:broad specificity phosphatase PhoE